MEYNQKHISELVNQINYVLNEKNDINESIKFVNKATFAFSIWLLISLGITVIPEVFNYGLISLITSVFSVSWGVYNNKKLNKTYDRYHEWLCKLVNEKHEYTLEYHKMLDNIKRLEEEKEEQIRLNKLKDEIIKNAFNIKPELRLEWINLILRLANNEILYNTIIKAFNKVSQNDYNIDDLYFNLDNKIYSLSGLLIKYSINSKSYQEYCYENNIKYIKGEEYSFDKINEYASYNLEYIQIEKELEWVNLIDDLIKNKQDIFVNTLFSNLKKCQEEDFININDMFVCYNNHGYSIIDLLIYFSNKSTELLNYQNNKKLSRKKS